MRAWLYVLCLLMLLASPLRLEASEMLHPKFPVVEGYYQMTKDWSVHLPEKFNRRVEEGSLVIWHPGLTIWVSVWGNDKGESKETRLEQLRKRISKQAFDLEQDKQPGALLFSYRLKEEANDNRVPALYGFAFGENGHVQMAIYFNRESDLPTAKAILKSLREKAAP